MNAALIPSMGRDDMMSEFELFLLKSKILYDMN